MEQLPYSALVPGEVAHIVTRHTFTLMLLLSFWTQVCAKVVRQSLWIFSL